MPSASCGSRPLSRGRRPRFRITSNSGCLLPKCTSGLIPALVLIEHLHPRSIRPRSHSSPIFCLQSRPTLAACFGRGDPANGLRPRPHGLWRPHGPRQRGGGYGDAAPKLSERPAAASTPRVRHRGCPKACRAAGVRGTRRPLGFGR